jgi:excisionase family DNA binding protein
MTTSLTWLSASQAAKACGVSRGTIHRWIVDGVIPRESLISSGRVHRVSAGWCMRRSA